MIGRADLESARSPKEMHALLEGVYEDRESYPDTSFYQREGILKILLEEYAPLAALAMHLNATSAHLSPQSHPGPDATLSMKCLGWRYQLRVQITLADQDHQKALGREVLRRGKPHFPTTRKIKDKATREIRQEGRVLRPGTPSPLPTEKVIAAVARKADKFHPGTDILVVGLETRLWYRHDLLAWRRQILERLVYPNSCPYDRLFLICGTSVIEASPASRTRWQHIHRLAGRLIRVWSQHRTDRPW